MTTHTFLFRWKPDVTEVQVAEATAGIRALGNRIPGLLSIHVGPNISPRSQGFGFGGAMHFTDRASLEAYHGHPAHQALLPCLMPLIADVIEIDFEA